MKKKNRILVYPFVVMGLLLILTNSCEKEDNSNPLVYGTVIDIDGNTYKTITIGTQTWMAENLKTSKYRNGDPIPNVTDGAEWASLTSGAYCWYNNDGTANKDIYGALYNWFTLSDSRNIAPVGWHVPTDADWTILTNYLGGESVAGGKMKELGTTHWNSPNTNATNEVGFTAQPGGSRDPNPPTGPVTFSNIGLHGYWWSTTNSNSSNPPHVWIWCRSIHNNLKTVTRFGNNGFNNESYGFSVRCVKD